jgi:hypothetical protein
VLDIGRPFKENMAPSRRRAAFCPLDLESMKSKNQTEEIDDGTRWITSRRR